MENDNLNEMTASLMMVDDETWGMYALSRDILNNRIPENKKEEMIFKSIRCGEEYASRVMRDTGLDMPADIAARYHLHVDSAPLPFSEKRILFAQFTPPDQIIIFQDPIDRYNAYCTKAMREEDEPPIPERKIRDILLGHEIFHYIESRYSSTIYTQTEKITLWHIFAFQYKSTIRALGEIASMAFSRRLNQIPYSPFLLDVLLFFGYSPEEAVNIYKDIMNIKSKENK